MSRDDENFITAFHVRRCDTCCGNCRHFDRQYEDSGCAHPRQREFDKTPSSETPIYDAYRGILVDEGYVCDLWEKKGEAEGGEE